ncbi:MAG: class II glutamine amidotransferase [Ruminococcus sp.]|nr:class II glutamine amidotransferase [Ruminococcus sp.]
MCELFGFTSSVPTDIREYLRVFYSHSSRHPHGWGIMRENGSRREVIKESCKASDSLILNDVINGTSPQTTLLAHIRFATVGSIKQENCHPYTGRDKTGREWTLIHNGTIFSARNMIKYMNSQLGDTDSERLFLYLMDRVDEVQGTTPLSDEQRFALVEELVIDAAPRNKLNLMIYDGDLLYVHKNMRDTMRYKHTSEGYIFSTTALGSGWGDYPMGQLVAFRSGEAVFNGRVHDGIFIPTLEYITAMDAMNI